MSEEPFLASDGLPARRSGRWARDKLHYVAHYVSIFNTGQKNAWPSRAYIDLMAGPGMCRVKDSAEEFIGSPLIALQSPTPFTAVVLVEEDAVLFDALQRRCAAPGLRPQPELIRGDCNDLAIIDRIRRIAGPNTLSFCFVDLLGFNVAFETIRRLTEHRRMDLLFSFPEQGLNRNALMADRDQREKWNRFFGTERWQDTIAAAKARHHVYSLPIELGRLYRLQLQTIGYETQFLQDPMKNTRAATLYRPLFGSKNARGSDFWRKISLREPTGQTHLVFD